MISSVHKTSELLLVLLTGVCLVGGCLFAAESSTSNNAPQPAAHPVAGSTHAGTKNAGTHTTVHSATKRGVTSPSGSAHHSASKSASLASSGTAAKKTSNHSAAYPSQHKGSGAHNKRPRRLSGQQRLARLHLQPERVQEIQQALIREGYLEGDTTGQWDSHTREAMLRYQTMHGFPATGLPEAKSLMKLGLGSHPLPPELDHGSVGVGSPAASPGVFSVSPSSPPVSQAVPPSSESAEPANK